MLSGSLLGFLCGFSWSLGWECCLVWCPLRPAPLFAWVFGVPSLFFLLFGMFAGDVFLFFFAPLSLSQALGKPKPRLGVGFPLVFSSCWTRTSSTTRTPSSASTPRRRPRTCFFFSVRRSRGCFLGMVLAALSVCLSVYLSICLSACACQTLP